MTMKDVASQVEGMEARMGTLQSEFKQDLDGLHSTIQQLKPEEIMARITKINHLEHSISVLEEGI